MSREKCKLRKMIVCIQMSTSREIQIISNSEVLSQDQYLHKGCLSSSIFYKVGYVYCLFD